MIAMKSVRLATVVFAGALVTMAGSAFAETSWERNHPRRDQVNDRLANQSRRINHEYREGEITRGQELARPIADSGLGDGTVQIDIDEQSECAEDKEREIH